MDWLLRLVRIAAQLINTVKERSTTVIALE
jgi:hypothetical protein